MLFILNLYSAVGQLYPSKSGKKDLHIDRYLSPGEMKINSRI